MKWLELIVADRRGLGMTEYLIILVVVAVAGLAAWTAFGSSIVGEGDEARVAIRTMEGATGSAAGAAPGSRSGASGAGGATTGGEPGTSGDGRTGVGGSPNPSRDAAMGDSGGEGESGADEDGSWLASTGSFAWGTAKGIGLGAWDTAKGVATLAAGTAKGAWWVATHPGESIGAVGHAVTHPLETGSAAWSTTKAVASGIGDALGNAWDTARHGTAEERGELLGRGVFEVALAATGVGATTKARWLSKTDDVARAGARGGDDAARAAAGVARRKADDAARGREVARRLHDETSSLSPRQASDDLDELYRSAAKAKPELDNITDEVAQATGGASKIPDGLKGRERALEKITDDYGGDAAHVVDLTRSSIYYDSVDDMYRGFDALSERVDIVRVKDRVANPTSDGYRDMLVNVRTSDGHVGEIQVHLKPIIEAKGKAHGLYEEAEVLRRRLSNQGSLAADEAAELNRLQNEMRETYDAAYEQAVKQGGGGP